MSNHPRQTAPAENTAPCLTKLPTWWRTEAATLRGWGASAEALVLERAADELERAMREHGDDSVTLNEAAEITGYSIEHLGRLVRQGKLTNVGRKHAPRVRRGDLSRKPGSDPLPSVPDSLTLHRSRASIARAIATAKG